MAFNDQCLGMDLVTRGRLSVQRVDEKAWDAILLLAEKGGWEKLDLKPRKGGKKSAAPKLPKAPLKKKTTASAARKVKPQAQSPGGSENEGVDQGGTETDLGDEDKEAEITTGSKRKRKAKPDGQEFEPQRRSTRARR